MNIKMNVRIAIVVASLVALAACAPFAPTPTPTVPPLLQTVWARVDQQTATAAARLTAPTRALTTPTATFPIATPIPKPTATPGPTSFLRQVYVLKSKGTVLNSNTGPVLASTAPDSTIILSDVATGKEIGRLKEPPGKVEGIALSPDRQLVATLSNFVVTVWQVASGTKKYTLEMHSAGRNINATDVVLFSPDARIVAATSNDNTFTLWDAATGKVIRTIEAGDWVRDLAFSPDGRIVAAGLNGTQRIALWDLTTGKEFLVQGKHGREVFAVAFSPDGRVVASGGADNLVKLWDVASGQEIRAFVGHTDWVNALAFLADGRYLASQSDDKTVKLWDIALGRHVATYTGFEIGGGRYLVSRDADGTERLWEADAQALNLLPQVPSVPTFTPRPTITPTSLPAWTTFHNTRGRFAIVYPSGWKVDDNPKGLEGKSVFLGGVGVNEPGVLMEIRFSSTSIPQTHEELARDHVQAKARSPLIGNFEGKAITSTTLAGLPAARVEYSFSTREGDFRGIYTVTVRQGIVYEVDVFAIVTSAGRVIPGFESRQQIMEQIITGFTLE